jgi:hypothetical protein
MSIERSAAGIVELKDACTAEDAEVLLQVLLATPAVSVDWQACESVHTAVIQVLLAAKIAPTGMPASDFLRDKVAPMLMRNLK